MQARPDGFRLYDGFEPSGRMHIAQGVFKSLNVNTCTANGGEFVFWVADFFALMNDKMGGDLDKIRKVGEYLVQVWRAAGMNMERVKFVWASEAIVQQADLYSRLVVDIARRFTVARLEKCCQIMGRKEGNLSAAQVLYPLMQCADVFFLQADVCQLGMDQRKVNMLAREYAALAKRRFKPIVLSHHMLFGLKQGQEKMSKSDADSAVFMEDSAEDVERKIAQAFCPSTPVPVAKDDDGGDDEGVMSNPCLDYIKHICFRVPAATFLGRTSYAQVRADFVAGRIAEPELKLELARSLNRMLEPVRAHFAQGEPKALLDEIKSFKNAPAVAVEELDVPEEAEAGRVKRASKPALRRGTYLPEGARAAAVFAPVPSSPRIEVGVVLALVKRLSAAKAQQHAVLVLPDLGALACNALADPPHLPARKHDGKGPFADVAKTASPTAEVDAWYDTLVASLKSAAPRVMEGVVVVRQSEIMARDAMNYWISVINCGRAVKLSQVLQALRVDGEGERVGTVIAALLHMGDVLALGPCSHIFAGADEEPVHRLTLDFFESELARKHDCGGAPPVVLRIEAPAMRLPKAVGDADVDQALYINDADKAVATKVKRAFCEEANAAFCPVLDALEVVELAELAHVFPSHVLHVKRDAANGGDVALQSPVEARLLFTKGGSAQGLHPGDLKTTATPLLQRIVAQTKAESKVLDACEKRWAKKP